MTRVERIGLLAQLEIKRRAVASRTWTGVALFLAVLALGAWNYWRALPPRPEDDRLFGYAYLLALLVALHFGIARDRRFRFDAFLTSNLLAPAESYAAKIVAVVVGIAVASVAAFALALISSLGDVEYAAWYSILMCLVALAFLPVIALTELLLDIEYPVAIVALLFTAAISIVNRAGGARAVLHVLALDPARYDYGDMGRLALRVVVALLLTIALFPLYRWRLWPRSRVPLQGLGYAALASSHERNLPSRKRPAGRA